MTKQSTANLIKQYITEGGKIQLLPVGGEPPKYIKNLSDSLIRLERGCYLVKIPRSE